MSEGNSVGKGIMDNKDRLGIGLYGCCGEVKQQGAGYVIAWAINQRHRFLMWEEQATKWLID
jgi:hypothetical protein